MAPDLQAIQRSTGHLPAQQFHSQPQPWSQPAIHQMPPQMQIGLSTPDPRQLQVMVDQQAADDLSALLHMKLPEYPARMLDVSVHSWLHTPCKGEGGEGGEGEAGMDAGSSLQSMETMNLRRYAEEEARLRRECEMELATVRGVAAAREEALRSQLSALARERVRERGLAETQVQELVRQREVELSLFNERLRAAETAM